MNNTAVSNRKEITLKDVIVYILFVFIVLMATILDRRFFTVNNFMVICKQTATTAMIAFGMTFVITCGEIDLSIGGVVCLVGMISTLVLEHTGNVLLASLVGLATGLIFGLINGLLIAKLKMVAFLATLGTQSIALGIAKTITAQKPVTVYEPAFLDIWGKAEIGGFPVIMIWSLVAFVICFILYKYTSFGNYVKACGGNRTAAIFSGVKTDGIIIRVMVLSGLCAALCGMMTVSRMSQGRPDIGTELGTDAITAVELGGTPFTGGSGSVATSFIGAFVLITLTNALVILGVPTTAQTIVKGVVVIAAVAISTSNISLKKKK